MTAGWGQGAGSRRKQVRAISLRLHGAVGPDFHIERNVEVHVALPHIGRESATCPVLVLVRVTREATGEGC